MPPTMGRLAVAAMGVALTLGGSVVGTTQRAGAGVELTFDQEAPAATPRGLVFLRTAGTVDPRWDVRRERETAFLVHAAGAGPSGGIALALVEGAEHENVRVSARLRLAAGERAGGVVWRVRDAQQFYMAALDLAAQRLEVYRVIGGNRVRLRSRQNLQLDPGAWHTLAAVHEGNEIRVYLGGLQVFEFWDRALRGSGLAGVWSAAAATVHVDWIRVQAETDSHEGARRRGRG